MGGGGRARLAFRGVGRVGGPGGWGGVAAPLRSALAAVAAGPRGCIDPATLGGGLVSPSATLLCSPRHGGGGRDGRGGKGGGGRASAASQAGLPSERTPGSGRFEHDLHPAAPLPRRHVLADREPRQSVGVALRAGVLRGWMRRSRGWQHGVPHGVHPRGAGQHRGSGRARVPGRGEGPNAPQEAPDGAIVGDTHPMAPGAPGLGVPPFDEEHPALGRVDPGLRGGCLGSAGWEGAQVLEGRPQGLDPGDAHALPPTQARGPPERGCPAVPPAEGLVEGGARYRQALGHAIPGRQSPPGVRARPCQSG